eukprot:5448938-Prymnesium_polylepis.1
MSDPFVPSYAYPRSCDQMSPLGGWPLASTAPMLAASSSSSARPPPATSWLCSSRWAVSRTPRITQPPAGPSWYSTHAAATLAMLAPPWRLPTFRSAHSSSWKSSQSPPLHRSSAARYTARRASHASHTPHACALCTVHSRSRSGLCERGGVCAKRARRDATRHDATRRLSRSRAVHKGRAQCHGQRDGAPLRRLVLAEVPVAQPAARDGPEARQPDAFLARVLQHTILGPPVEQRVLHLVGDDRHARVHERAQVRRVKVARRDVAQQPLALQRHQVPRRVDKPAVAVVPPWERGTEAAAPSAVWHGCWGWSWAARRQNEVALQALGGRASGGGLCGGILLGEKKGVGA